MRTYIDNTAKIKYIYPEAVVFTHDNNLLSIKATDNTSFAVKIKLTQGNTSNEIAYYNADRELLIDLHDNILNLYNGSNHYFVCEAIVYELDGTERSIMSFSMNVLTGKTFNTKTHGNDDIIVIYNADELSAVEFYSPTFGITNIGNTTQFINNGLNILDLRTLITTPGDYTINLKGANIHILTGNIISDVALNPGCTTIYFDAIETLTPTIIEGGDIWNKKIVFPKTYTVRYEEVCDKTYPVFELRYNNADGCIRYLAGKLLNITNANNLKNYYPADINPIKNEPKFINNDTTLKLTVGFSNIEKGQEVGDIIFADIVEFRDINGNWSQCIIDTKELSYNDLTDEFTLDIITCKEK